MAESAREMGQEVAMEVYGLFAAHIPQHGRAAMRELSTRTRHGLVPDFMMWIRLGRDPVKQYLLELKCAHLSPTWYAPKPWRLQEEAQGKSCLVVEKRAEKVAAEYVRKAQRTDQTYCGTAPGTVGPIEARLRTFDKTVPLVFGAFGEASAAVIEKYDANQRVGRRALVLDEFVAQRHTFAE